MRKRLHGIRRTLDARPDELDGRDHRFAGAPSHVPATRSLAQYLKSPAPLLDQGAGGGSVAFALATVANHLMRCLRAPRDAEPVSPWMMQAMAARYDPWRAHERAGIAARSALRAWHAHGVCAEALWSGPLSDRDPTLTRQRAEDAALRPLARYLRVDAQRLDDLQAAVAHNGILLATAWIHEGWSQPRGNGTIERAAERIGCHAFAIVAYDLDGFWIQNAWGRRWGREGFGYLSYDDWLMHGADAWCVQLAAPVRLTTTPRAQRARYTQCPAMYSQLRAHVVCVDDAGALRETGPFGNGKGDVEAILRNDFPRTSAAWPRKRLLVLALGDLEDEALALEQIRGALPAYLSQQVYPVALLWRTNLAAQLRVLAQIALEGSTAPDARDRLGAHDDALERGIREAGGERLWDELKRGAMAASEHASGAARLLAGHVAHLRTTDAGVELHAWACGAGALLLGPFAGLLTAADGFGLALRSVGLIGAACTPAAFHDSYAPALARGAIGHLTIFQLREASSAKVIPGYGRSFLELVAHALEAEPRIAGSCEGTPLLGLSATAFDERVQGWLAQRRVSLATLAGSMDLAAHAEHVLARIAEPRPEAEWGVLGTAEPAPRYVKARRR